MSPHIDTLIEDEHGCVFTGPGGGMGIGLAGGKMELAIIEHPVFPRRQKQFKMIMQKGPNIGPFASAPVTLMIPNPTQLSPVEWKPEPFPIARQSGDLKVTLNRVASTYTPATPVFRETWRFEPQFEIVQNGQPTRDWTCASMVFSDATGNTHESFLCPHEPALKLTMELTRTAEARFATNEIWSPPALDAPEPGKFQVLNGTGTVEGVTFRLATFSGPGVVTYSNGIPVKATPPDGALRPLFVTSSTVGTGNSAYTVSETKSDTSVLAIGVTGLKAANDLLIFAIDDQGGKTNVNGYSSQAGNIFFHQAIDALGNRTVVTSLHDQTGAVCFLSIPMEKTTKTIRMNFVVQKRRKMEFTFKPPELKREAAPKPTPQAMPPVARAFGGDKGFIRGVPAKEARHIAARDFLRSLAKDTFEGQKIASELVKNGYGIEYLPAIYMDSMMLGSMRENGWARDGNMDRAVEMRKTMMFDDYSRGNGRNGLPAFTNQVLLRQLLELKPKKQFYNGSHYPGMSNIEPEDQWLSEKDVLHYIKEHPAVFCWMPVTLNITENLNLNTTNNQPVMATQSSGPGMIRGTPAKKFRHVTATYFLASTGKDTYEGQKIASELITHGLGIEYLPYIYFDSKNLGTIARGAELHPQSKNLLEQKRTSLISEYCSAGGRKGMPPFPNRDLLASLLDLHPAKDYEPDNLETITAVSESEEQWLSEKEVLNYIKQHPAASPPK
jgi:hypothetical protein